MFPSLATEAGKSERLQAIADRIGVPVSAFYEPQAPHLPLVIDVDAEEFGFLISEAFHDCNDMDGPHWPTVARKVAEAIGVTLAKAI